MSDPLDTVIQQLSARRNGSGYMAKCPAHQDDVESLHISTGKDGRVLIHCHAGCTTDAVLAALGLQPAQLFPQRTKKQPAKIDALYDYVDEQGRLLFQSVRYVPKRFSQRRPDGHGGWVWSLDGTRRVIYRLPELLATPPDVTVYVCEGEKDVDCLRLLGLVATTNPQGAGKWRSEYAAWFKGRQVVVLPDNDDAGRQHAQEVARLLNPVAAWVRVVDLPNLATKGDVTDWLGKGHTVEELESLVAAAPIWTDQPPLPTVPAMTLDEVHATFQRWLYLPDTGALDVMLGAYEANKGDGNPVWLLVVGTPGSGKTEQLQSLFPLPGVRGMATFTEAALLSGTSAKDRAKTAKGGILFEMGAWGVLILKDFGSVLAMHHDTRQIILQALREIYDGHWVRDLGSDGGMRLEWAGKLGLIGGATPAIDEHHAIMGALGERFIFYRIPEADDAGKQGMARRALAMPGEETAMRRELGDAIAGLYANEASRPTPEPLSEPEQEYLISLAIFATLARATVIRSTYGNHEITLVPGAEAPTRITIVLAKLFQGMLRVGVPRERAWDLIRRCALDSMPQLRRRAIETLGGDNRPRSTSEMALAVEHPTNTTRRTLEDLAAYNILTRTTQGPGKADLWSLSQKAAALWFGIRTLPESAGEGVYIKGPPYPPYTPIWVHPKIGDSVWLLSADGQCMNDVPWTIVTIEPGDDGAQYATFAESSTGWALTQCELAKPE